MSVLEHLTNPKASARGFTRWWWFGGAVTKEGIRHELEEMARNHIGGVEIQMLYPLEHTNPAQGIENTDFFSPRFFELLDYTLTVAAELNMEVDLTLGSGWPYGGSFVNESEAPQILIPYSHDVVGECEFTYDYTCLLPGEVERVILVKMENGRLLPETARDITENLSTTWVYTWPWGKKLNKIAIPNGHYKIFTFVVANYRQPVGKPAPNMQGLAIDHCRKDVSDMYFRTLGQTLIDKLGRGRIRSFFCDSIELGGNNWTSIMLDEFSKRRGYDLTQYMPALWADMGEVTGYIRHDYFQTFGELTQEGFFDNFTAWCERLGVKSRVQAHGIWSDIIKTYGSAHIPEGETFGDHDINFVNTIHRRLAQAAGAIYDRKIVSNESFTWLRMPRFLVTPEMMKRAVDVIFADGINHIINHGWAYSPKTVGKPGWVFYASSMISENNTWWEFYAPLSEYIHKVSSLMQGGAVVSEVGILVPQADIWADSPMSELHMSMKIEEYLGRETVNDIQRAGHWFTYLNYEAVTDIGEITANGLVINENIFKTIILIGLRRVPLCVMERLRDFVESGGTLICAETLPDKSPGLVDARATENALQQINTMFDTYNVNEFTQVGAGKTAFCSDRGAVLIELLNRINPPYLFTPSRDIGFIRRKIDGKDVYFIANISPNAVDTLLDLPFIDENFRIVNPLTNEEIAPKSVNVEGGRLLLGIHFEENMSVCIAFGEKPRNAKMQKVFKRQKTINGWKLTVNGETVFTGMDVPTTWEQYPQTRYHCGEGVYEADFATEITDSVHLELSELHCCAEVSVNGQTVGQMWAAPFRLDISKYLVSGENHVSIRAVNTWFNHFLNPDIEEPMSAEAVSDSYPYFTKPIDEIRAGRLYGGYERAFRSEPIPSGIDGVVRLVVTEV